MNHREFAKKVLEAVRQRPDSIPEIALDEQRRKNAGRAMTQLICNRLGMSGTAPKHIRHNTFEWNGGLISIRNARIVDHHWTTITASTLEQLHTEALANPVAYFCTYWAIDERTLHVWVLPEDMAYQAIVALRLGVTKTHRTIEIFPGEHRIANSKDSPNFEEYYAEMDLTDEEVAKTLEAIKLDDAIKQAGEQQDVESSPDEEEEELTTSRYTSSRPRPRTL